MDTNFSPILIENPLYSQNNEDNMMLQNITDFVLPTLLEEQNINITQQPKKRSVSSNLTAVDHHDHHDDKKKRKKIIHREVERQRRHEMSSLHTSLKSLLPLQYIKGKRSMSDHLAEAIKYIKHMQQKIESMNERRDALRKELSNCERNNNVRVYEDDVIVNIFKGSLEVIVSTTCDDEFQGLPLSRVLQCLIEQGLDVVSSISKKVNTRLVHSIHAQDGDKDSSAIDAEKLKKKIAAIRLE